MKLPSEESIGLAKKLIVLEVGPWIIVEINGKFGCFWGEGLDMWADILLAYNIGKMNTPDFIMAEYDSLDKAHAWCLLEMKKSQRDANLD